MNRFQFDPLAATAIAAVVMTVITFGLFVIVPATIRSDGEYGRAQAPNVVAPTATEGARYSNA